MEIAFFKINTLKFNSIWLLDGSQNTLTNLSLGVLKSTTNFNSYQIFQYVHS